MRLVKLLIDENLSPAVAHKLRIEGLDVVHVRDRGLLAGSDAEVFEKAYATSGNEVTASLVFAQRDVSVPPDTLAKGVAAIAGVGAVSFGLAALALQGCIDQK